MVVTELILAVSTEYIVSAPYGQHRLLSSSKLAGELSQNSQASIPTDTIQ